MASVAAGSLPSVRRGVKSPTVYFVFDVAKNGHTVAYTRPDALRLISRMPDGSYIYLSRLGLRLPGYWVKQGGQLVETTTEPADSLKSTYYENPALAVFGNPGRGRRVTAQLSKRVYAVQYRHVEDGKSYQHKFGAGVCMELLSDGSVRLYHRDGKPLFGDF